ncbi:MAG: hypothetical protein ACJ74T_06575 [Pyrinomonadaceae bacterium]
MFQTRSAISRPPASSCSEGMGRERGFVRPHRLGRGRRGLEFAPRLRRGRLREAERREDADE